MIERTNGRRLAAFVGAAALGLFALGGAGSAAHAATDFYGNIDGDRTGFLQVHKYLHQSGTHEGDISAQPEATDFTDPVAGVVFTLYPLVKDGETYPVDMTVPETWEGLADLTPGADCTAPAGYSFAFDVDFPATDASGIANLLLPVGLYQVCETSVENATVGGEAVHITDRALPFILTLPMPHEDGWLYDVYAYPKNGDSSLEKSVEVQDDNGLGLGSEVKFPMTVNIPTLGAGKTWTQLAISDVFDSRLAPANPVVESVTLDGSVLDPSFYSVSVDGQTAVLKFTPAGLGYLNETHNGHAGEALEVVFVTTIESLGDGEITNTGGFWPNDPGIEDDSVDYEDPDVPSNEVKINWGDVQIIKRAAGTTADQGLLKGAVFEIYDAVDPYAADCTTAVKTGTALTVDGETEFESDEYGVVSIPGLFVSDNVNDPQNAAERCYVLVEIAAPAGYVLPDTPETGIAVAIGQTAAGQEYQIENTQSEVPELPLTGSAGQVMMVAAGVAAVAVAVGLMLMNRRKAERVES